MACRARALEHATVLFGTVARPFQGLPSTLGAGIVSPEAASASTTRNTVGPFLPRPPSPSTSSPEHVHGRCPWCTAASPILSHPDPLSRLGSNLLSPVHPSDNLLLPLVPSSTFHGRSAAAGLHSDSGKGGLLPSSSPHQESIQGPATLFPPSP